VTGLAALNTAFQTAYTASTEPTTRTSVTIAATDTARVNALAVVRPLAVQCSLNAGVSDGNKTALGVTVRKTTPTPIPAPTTSPTLSLVAAIHNQHTLTYRDQATPTSKAKPFGAVALELWQAIGTTPAVDPDQCKMIKRITKGPFVVAFDGLSVGKVATYFGRWVTQSGVGGESTSGPWSAGLVVGII
jgi:hypothetical protein